MALVDEPNVVLADEPAIASVDESEEDYFDEKVPSALRELEEDEEDDGDEEEPGPSPLPLDHRLLVGPPYVDLLRQNPND